MLSIKLCTLRGVYLSLLYCICSLCCHEQQITDDKYYNEANEDTASIIIVELLLFILRGTVCIKSVANMLR